MIQALQFKNFFLLILIIGISACGLTELKENLAPNYIENNNSELHHQLINMIDNKGINFDFTLVDTTEFGENFMIDIEYVVTNKTSKEINYLNQSCNGLDYYLVIRPDSYKVMPLIGCNTTWAEISKLDKMDSIKFKTQILKFKNSGPIEKIGIDFIALDKYIPFNTLKEKPELVERIYRSETQINNIIWGNKK